VSSLTPYLSRRIVQHTCLSPSASYANNVTKLPDLLAASYYDRTDRRHHHQDHTRRLSLYIIHAAGILIEIIPVASCSKTSACLGRLTAMLTVSRSTQIYLQRLTRDRPYRRHPHRYRTRRVLVDITHAAGILIDIVLVAS